MPDSTEKYQYIRCPRCDRRIFDIAKFSDDEAIIRVKCLKCELTVVYIIR